MKNKIFGAITALVSLALLWIALSGYFTLLELSLGVLSCLFVLFITIRLDLISEESRLMLVARLPAYFIWLSWEIIISNLRVSRIILSRQPKLQRGVVHSTVRQQTTLGVAIYANSITLTPGTVTLDAEADDLTVHVLVSACADDILGNAMNDRVARLEGAP